MERKTRFLISLFILLTSVAYSQYKSAIYKAYVSNDMALWKAVLNIMGSKSNKSHAEELEFVEYQHGYIAWLIGNERKDEARKYLDMMWKSLEKLEKSSMYLSSVYAYRAAAYGFEIALNPVYAPIYGNKGLSSAEKAIELDKTNPLGYVQYGNAKYFSPKIFGGSKELAISNYLKALELMERNPQFIKENWNYLNLLVAIAKAYEETRQYELAKKYYEKILRVEPGFTWVKNELYPQLLKKM